MKVGAVVIAAGYGSCRHVGGDPYPKLLEDLAGKSMIARVLGVIAEASLDDCVVVVNPASGAEIEKHLKKEGWHHLHYVVQPDRYGTADAAERAIPILQERGITDVMVLYGDMPLWRAHTIKLLLREHCAKKPVLSMVSVRLDGTHAKEIERYGRIVRDRDGRVARIFEVGDPIPDEYVWGSVNPSLWVWNAQWLMRHAKLVAPAERPDGRQSERYLPVLVGLASDQGASIVDVALSDATEALGVNTASELSRVREVFAARA